MEPTEADLLALLAALRYRLGPRIEGTGITLHWKVTDLPPLEWLTPRYSLHILRILQEAFTNIMKHSGASEISIETRATDDGYVEVIVTDNGRGFDLAEAEHGRGKGLMNQRRRAQVLGGQVVWDCSNKGATLTLRLPCIRPDTP
jgi:signal transduction histidine kinase